MAVVMESDSGVFQPVALQAAARLFLPPLPLHFAPPHPLQIRCRLPVQMHSPRPRASGLQARFLAGREWSIEVIGGQAERAVPRPQGDRNGKTGREIRRQKRGQTRAVSRRSLLRPAIAQRTACKSCKDLIRQRVVPTSGETRHRRHADCSQGDARARSGFGVPTTRPRAELIVMQFPITDRSRNGKRSDPRKRTASLIVVLIVSSSDACDHSVVRGGWLDGGPTGALPLPE